MKKTGFLHDDRFTLHQTGGWHPECPDRIKVISDGVNESDICSDLEIISADPANQRWIEAVHPVTYIMRFEEACTWGMPDIDHQDNSICRDSYDIALLSAGGVLKAIDSVMEGNVQNAFCAVRPPGHHAEVDKAMGFCYFNNVAVGARYLQRQWDVKKVGIIDFDVHHGNGTQAAFWSDKNLFYGSTHQMPLFPGTGAKDETGVGNIWNAPLSPGDHGEDFRTAVSTRIAPALDEFAIHRAAPLDLGRELYLLEFLVDLLDALDEFLDPRQRKLLRTRMVGPDLVQFGLFFLRQ